MADVRLDGRVALVTGSGGGLGRSHALAFAARGAKVVINDLGGSFKGEGADKSAADKVVDEIKAMGGDAIANYDSVSTPEGASGMVKAAVDKWGKIDIVVNNAGILRDVSLLKMTQEDWDKIIAVHLTGSYLVTKAAFPVMKDNKYGRIIYTTSAAGLYGNFGQVNYAAAKLGIVGIANSVKIEGERAGIKVATIAPLAASRMTETVMPPDVLAMLKPEYVSALVTYLASEQFNDTGAIYEVGGGYYSRVQIEEGKGAKLDTSKPITPEDIVAKWAQINDMSQARPFGGAMEAAAAPFAS
jgi:3-hydroxyacyl-CoA dehydrogenase/3a,7a,12a-trihydroxy-5b-cholest-24-enoyl-CoA hydratase